MSDWIINVLSVLAVALYIIVAVCIVMQVGPFGVAP